MITFIKLRFDLKFYGNDKIIFITFKNISFLDTQPVIPRQDPNKRLERIEALKNQVLTCEEAGCGMRYDKLQNYKRHLRFAHGLPIKKRSVEFYLRTSLLTKKTRRSFFNAKLATNRALLRRLAVCSWAESDLVNYAKLREHGKLK